MLDRKITKLLENQPTILNKRSKLTENVATKINSNYINYLFSFIYLNCPSFFVCTFCPSFNLLIYLSLPFTLFFPHFTFSPHTFFLVDSFIVLPIIFFFFHIFYSPSLSFKSVQISILAFTIF